MPQTVSKIKITPADNGRRMSLAEFEDAEVQEGYHYELGRGAIVVGEVPNPWHELTLDVIRPPAKCQTPLVPGLEFDCQTVFNAGV